MRYSLRSQSTILAALLVLIITTTLGLSAYFLYSSLLSRTSGTGEESLEYVKKTVTESPTIISARISMDKDLVLCMNFEEWDFYYNESEDRCYVRFKDCSRYGNDGIFYGNVVGELKPEHKALVFVANYGAQPWGTTPNFPDPTASWIWKYPNAYQSVPVETFFVSKRFYLENDTTLEICITVDDVYYLYIDGNLIGTDSSWMNTECYTVNLSRGEHLLTLNVSNEGGPAGILLTARDKKTGKILFNSQGDGTWIIGPIWVEGRYGSALEFDGQDDYVVISYSNNIFSRKYLTVCLWLKLNTIDNTEDQFIYIRSFGTTSSRYLYLSDWCLSPPRNCIHFGVLTTSGTWGGGRNIATSRVLQANRWYFLCGVVDTMNGVLKVFLDGKEISHAFIPTGDIPGDALEVWIGQTPEGYQRLNGIIDEVFVWNRVLSEEEIKACYEDIRNCPRDESLALHLSFDEGKGRYVNDLSMIKKGKWGYYVEFTPNPSGINDSLEILNSRNINPKQITIFARENCSGQSWDHDQWILGKKAYSWADNGYALFYGWGVDVHFTTGSTSKNDAKFGFAGTEAFNVWHSIAGTYDGSKLAIYADGVLKNYTFPAHGILPNNESIFISNPRIFVFNGSLDEIYLFKRALSSDEIKLLHENYSIFTPLTIEVDNKLPEDAPIIILDENRKVLCLLLLKDVAYNITSIGDTYLYKIYPSITCGWKIWKYGKYIEVEGSRAPLQKE